LAHPGEKRKQRGESKYRASIWLLLALFGLLSLRLIWLQGIQSKRYRKWAEDNRVRAFRIQAPRGEIRDRVGKILAQDRPSYTVSIIPSQFDKSKKPKLAKLLRLDSTFIDKKIEEPGLPSFEPVRLKRDVDFHTICWLQEHGFSGVIYELEPRRFYPYGEATVHLLGYVGQLSPGEYEKLKALGYRYNSVIGQCGLEREYEDLLIGQDGVEYWEVTAYGKTVGRFEDKPTQPPQIGSELDLSLDIDLQVWIRDNFPDTLNGSIVAINPRNGEVLALYSSPSFDPNLLSKVTQESTWTALRDDPRFPLLNRAIQATYPPGSILKPLVAAAALQEGLIKESTKLTPCTGAFRYGNRLFRCWEAHGNLDLKEAIIQSCDIYHYQLGIMLGVEGLSTYAFKSGLGKKQGIDLPGEVPGLISTPRYLNQRYGRGRWTSGVALNLAIGQGETLVTPLQMAVIFSAIANGGYLYTPFLVKAIKAPDGSLRELKRGYPQRFPFSPSVLKAIKEALVGVVNDEEGTGQRAKLRDFVVAGKTGTAQNPHGPDHAWFVGYAPATNPKITVAVLLENGGHGGATAATLAGRVIGFYLGKRGNEGI